VSSERSADQMKKTFQGTHTGEGQKEGQQKANNYFYFT
jgi:hypothetical protein